MTPLEAPAPYTPGFGSAPDPLFGRAQVLERIDESVRSIDWGVAGDAVRLVGLRGVGKTSLLREVERRVSETERLGQVLGRPKPTPWIVVRGEAGRDLLVTLAQQIVEAGRQLDRRRRWDVTVGLAVPGGLASIGASSKPVEPTGVQLGLVDLATVAAKKKRRVAVLVDELHESTASELKSITAAANRLNGTEHPMLLVTAELPGRLDLSTVTYFRDRAVEVPVGALTAAGAEAALRGPAQARGVSWASDAARSVVAAANGFPYALQVYARETWRAAGTGRMIDRAAATEGIRRGRVELGQLYKRRWSDLPERARRYLTVLAYLGPDGRAARSGQVASILGGNTTGWSQIRSDLLDEGAILAGDRSVRLALPGWDRWIRAQSKAHPILDAATVKRLDQVDADPAGRR